jgi:thiol-disulfide isomerase/thioredoxin
MEQNHIDWKKYVIVLFITGAIFATAIYVSNYFSQKKLVEVKNIQDKIAIDILSSETQFSLLEDSSCKDIASTTALSDELASLEDKLNYTEKDRGENDPEVISLKQNYSLLEIKDYLLMRQIAEKCKTNPVSIIYFYSNTDGECPDCQKEGYVLTQLRTDYPDLRVYSFDYDLDLSAIKTLLLINKIKGQLPALIINDDTYYGFQGLDTLEKLPILKPLVQAKMATSTKVK